MQRGDFGTGFCGRWDSRNNCHLLPGSLFLLAVRVSAAGYMRSRMGGGKNAFQCCSPPTISRFVVSDVVFRSKSRENYLCGQRVSIIYCNLQDHVDRV